MMITEIIRKISFSLVIFLIIFLGACRQTSFDYGVELSVDLDGHFLKDMQYTSTSSIDWNSYNNVLTKSVEFYGTDGTCTDIKYIYEGKNTDINNNGKENEGYILLKEAKATYTYDPETKILTQNKTNYTYYYKVNNGDYTYDSSSYDSVSDWDKFEMTVLFTEFNNSESAYLKDGDGWSFKYRYTYPDGKIEEGMNTFTIGTDAIDYFYQYKDSDNSNTTDHVDYEHEFSVTVTEKIPVDSVFEEGVTKTWNGYYTVDRERNWDSGVFTAWNNDPNGIIGSRYTFEVTHMGDFLVFSNNLYYIDRALK